MAQGVESFGSAITAGPAKTIFGFWALAAITVVGAGGAIWYLESRVAEKRGERLALPPVQAIGVPPPPSFGSSGGFGFNAGPFHTSQNLTAATAGGSSTAYVDAVEPSAPARPRKARKGGFGGG